MPGGGFRWGGGLGQKKKELSIIAKSGSDFLLIRVLTSATSRPHAPRCHIRCLETQVRLRGRRTSRYLPLSSMQVLNIEELNLPAPTVQLREAAGPRIDISLHGLTCIISEGASSLVSWQLADIPGRVPDGSSPRSLATIAYRMAFRMKDV
jgi:hypothetical protein